MCQHKTQHRPSDLQCWQCSPSPHSSFCCRCVVLADTPGTHPVAFGWGGRSVGVGVCDHLSTNSHCSTSQGLYSLCRSESNGASCVDQNITCISWIYLLHVHKEENAQKAHDCFNKRALKSPRCLSRIKSSQSF